MKKYLLIATNDECGFQGNDFLGVFNSYEEAYSIAQSIMIRYEAPLITKEDRENNLGIVDGKIKVIKDSEEDTEWYYIIEIEV